MSATASVPPQDPTAGTAPYAGATAPDVLEQSLLWVLKRLERPLSPAALRARVARDPGAWTFEQALEALESLGLHCTARPSLSPCGTWRLATAGPPAATRDP